MSTPIIGTTYPFDPTGTLASNLITGEQQILTAVNFADYHFIVPNIAPYFTASLQVTFQAVNGAQSTLVEGVDYVCTNVFHDASLACATPIAGSISFYNTALAGIVSLTYQTLGGIWTLDLPEITAILATTLLNPRITTWEQVTNQPVTFPVIDHEWDLVDLVGMSEVVTALTAIEGAILTQITGAFQTHVTNFGNPHDVTCAQIGAPTIAQMNASISSAIQAGSTTAVLTGLNATLTAPAIATDTLITAFGKLQGQITGIVDGTVPLLNPTVQGYMCEALTSITATTPTTSLDISLSPVYQVTIEANTSIVFNFANVTNAANKVIGFSILMVNGPTGGYGVSFPSNVLWAGGVTPPRTTTALAEDEWYFFTANNGVTWSGSLANQNVLV